MDLKAVVVLGIVAALAVAAGILISRMRARSDAGDESTADFDRTLKMPGEILRSEAPFADHDPRDGRFHLGPLSPVEREAYMKEWTALQRRFVDDPSSTVTQGYRLVTAVMAARDYPMSEAEQRAVDFPLAYPGLLRNYTFARDLAERHIAGESSTEDLRRAFVSLRPLFDELLNIPRHEVRERLAS